MPDIGSKGLTLVTGGAWSGKTAHAVSLVRDQNLVNWIGTASRMDAALSDHVDQVASLRPKQWQTLESATSLSNTLKSIRPDQTPIVIDSINQWLANIAAIDSGKYSPTQLKEHLSSEAQACLESLMVHAKIRPTIVVTAEVGWSVSPESHTAAAFRQILGQFNQELARQSQRVILMCCGIDQVIKS